MYRVVPYYLPMHRKYIESFFYEKVVAIRIQTFVRLFTFVASIHIIHTWIYIWNKNHFRFVHEFGDFISINRTESETLPNGNEQTILVTIFILFDFSKC